MGAVDRRVIHVQQARCPQLRQKDLVQTGPHASLRPVPKARQDVTSLQPIFSVGTSAQLTPVHRT
ncbi:MULTISPECIES: hypothetical protein [unclassified Streptomyces]|uniref:hypothetical protein n=1 Tax=unclassified Streptomyces TaxID=2593676 RepID=UPI003D929D1D